MRMIGLVLIAVCCWIFGVGYAIKEKNSLRVICEVERLIRYMAHQIEFYRINIFDIYVAFESDILDECGFSQMLAEGWEKAIDVIICPSNIKRELLLLGNGLGMKDTVEQVECCRRCISALEEYTVNEKKTISSKMKIYICLGFMVGTVILIIGI